MWRKHFFSQKNFNTYNVYSNIVSIDVYSLYTSTMYPIIPYLCAVSSKARGNASIQNHTNEILKMYAKVPKDVDNWVSGPDAASR